MSKIKGIYAIRCEQEDTVYIGSSVDIHSRWERHRYELNNQRHHCEQLQLAWDAYGDDSFVFEILEETDNIVLAEQTWLDTYKQVYNTSKKAHNPMANSAIANKVSKSLIANRHKNRQKLQVEDVILIKTAIRDGTHKVKELAELFGISTRTVYAIKNGRRWKHTKVAGFIEQNQRNYNDNADEIIKLYKKGVSCKEIANICGIKGLASIYDVLNANNIKPNRASKQTIASNAATKV